MRRKEIALIKETRQSELVKKIMGTIAPYLSLRSSDRIAIKINLSGSKEIYANTHYQTVDSLIFFLKENFGVNDFSVIEGSDGAYFSGRNTWDIFYKFKYKEIEMKGVKLVDLDELPHERVLGIDTLNGRQEVRFTGYDCDYMIIVVPPKTHHIFPAALAVVNLIGFIRSDQRVMMFGSSTSEMRKGNLLQQERYLQLGECAARNFISLAKLLPPSLVVIDGLYGMEGRGPVKGSPVFHGFAIASEDAILTDALTTYVMGFEVDEMPYLVLGYNEGLGFDRWQQVIGVEPQQVRFPYRPHPLFLRQKKWRENSSFNRRDENFKKKSDSDKNENNHSGKN